MSNLYAIRLYSDPRDVNDHETRVIKAPYLSDALLHCIQTMSPQEKSWLHRIEIDRAGILSLEEVNPDGR